MGEQLRRYKISGILKFCDDNIPAENLEKAKEVLADVDIAICGGTGCGSTKVELVESKIEHLGAYEED